MRKKLAKTVVTMLCVSMVQGMAGCGSDDKADKSADVTKEAESMTEAPKEDTQTEEVSLKMGDTYEFENLPKGTVDTPLNFVSEDATVAEVAQGKYIVAHNVGDTVVTVTCGTKSRLDMAIML